MKLISSLSPPHFCLLKFLEGLLILLRELLVHFGNLRVARKVNPAPEVTTAATCCSEIPSLEPRAVALRPLASLPETLQATVLEFTGPLAWFHVSCSDVKMRHSLWEASLVWTSVLSTLGVDTSNQGRAPSCLRASYRHHWFEINLFCVQPFVCSEVSTDLLRQALRACRGLDISDGTLLCSSFATRASWLLRGFEVHDAEAQQLAEALVKLIENRKDVFSDAQQADVVTAFKEAMDSKQLLDEAVPTLELLDADMSIDTDDGWEDSALWSQEDSALWSQTGCAIDEVLDQLIATLRESCSEGLITAECQ